MYQLGDGGDVRIKFAFFSNIRGNSDRSRLKNLFVSLSLSKEYIWFWFLEPFGIKVINNCVTNGLTDTRKNRQTVPLKLYNANSVKQLDAGLFIKLPPNILIKHLVNFRGGKQNKVKYIEP